MVTTDELRARLAAQALELSPPSKSARNQNLNGGGAGCVTADVAKQVGEQLLEQPGVCGNLCLRPLRHAQRNAACRLQILQRINFRAQDLTKVNPSEFQRSAG